MQIDISSEDALRIFERDIVGLIESASMRRAEFLLIETIGGSSLDDLAAAAEASRGARIEGWDELCADLLDAERHFRLRHGTAVQLVRLSLVNREEGGRPVDLTIDRRFFDRIDRGPGGALSAHAETRHFHPNREAIRPIRLDGLDAVTAIQRKRAPHGDVRETDGFRWRQGHVLSSLLLIVRYHQAVDRLLDERGVPLSVGIIVEMDHVAWPMEVGVNDFGPQVRRFIDAVRCPEKPFNAAAEIRLERAAQQRASFQNAIAATIAEYRELYRIVRMFPFYRYKARNKLGDMIDSQLKMACMAQDFPEAGVGWRMDKADFEHFLRSWTELRNPESVEDALDPRHVDALHTRWLDTARAKQFNLGNKPIALFELNLAWALRFGGPIVQDRWEHAEPYRVDR